MAEFESRPMAINCTISINFVAPSATAEMEEAVSGFVLKFFPTGSLEEGPVYPGGRESITLETGTDRVPVDTLIEMWGIFVDKVDQQNLMGQIRSIPEEQSVGDRNFISQLTFIFRTREHMQTQVVKRILVPRIGPTSIEPRRGDSTEMGATEFEVSTHGGTMTDMENIVEEGKIIREEIKTDEMILMCETF